jgi:hypothetical protein
MEVLLFVSFIFIPVVVIWFILWALESRRNKRRGAIYNANVQTTHDGGEHDFELILVIFVRKKHGYATRAPRHTSVLIMAYFPGVPRLKKGWPLLA